MKRVDITNFAVLSENFPARLRQLGFILWQRLDDHDQEQEQYVESPMVTIPAGSFFIGIDKGKGSEPESSVEDGETPLHRLTLDAYAIGKYPLTVAEYACFLKAEYHLIRDEDRQRQDHPGVNLAWHSAVDYAHWL